MILRLVATPIFGIAIFAGLLLTLVESNLTGKLLNANFYTDTIAAQDTYNRIYEDILADQAFHNTLQELLGIEIAASSIDFTRLIEKVLPREYLRAQEKRATQHWVAYFNEDTETLDLYLEIGPVLDQVKPIFLEYVDNLIESIPEKTTGPVECTPDAADEISDGYQAVFRSLGGEKPPPSLPSIKLLAEPCRGMIFDSTFPALFVDDSMGTRVTQALIESTVGIRAAFVTGNTHSVLKKAARSLTEPLVDETIAKIRDKLDEGERLNTIRTLAEFSPDITEEDIRGKFTKFKWYITQIQALGGIFASMLLFGSAILIGIVHLPNISSALRWPGIGLFLAGGWLVVVGEILESRTETWLLNSVIYGVINQIPGIPESAINLAIDLTLSFNQRLTEGLTQPALNVLILGALLLVTSMVLSKVKLSVLGLRRLGPQKKS